MGGGGTTTVQQSSPATIPAEAKEGYIAGRQYMTDVLKNPPVYEGKRVADISPLTTQYLNLAGSSLGKTSDLMTATRAQNTGTLQGDYLGGPLMQQAIASAASPLFQTFTQEVLPGLRGDALRVGAGGENSRMQLAQDNATKTFAQQLGTSVLAPIYEGERNRQIAVGEQTPKLEAADLVRLSALQAAGSAEQALEQQAIAADQAKFEEPLYRQAQAASGLGGANFSGGTVTTNASESPGAMGIMNSVGTMALLAKALMNSK